MELGIEGRVAFVCASTSGLGRACAEALAAEGVDVAITGRRGDVARQVAHAIEARGRGRALPVETNLLDPTGRERAVARVTRELGPIDILVLNGPGPKPGTATEVAYEDAGGAADRLVKPHIHLVDLVLPHMREQRFGRIVAIGSTAVVAPIPNLVLSVIGRSGLAGYLKVLAGQVAGDGVTVNVVHPGTIATPRIAQLDADQSARTGRAPEQVRASRSAAIPAGRLGEPAELGALVAFLASRPAAYITGVGIRVDGGATPVM